MSWNFKKGKEKKKLGILKQHLKFDHFFASQERRRRNLIKK